MWWNGTRVESRRGHLGGSVRFSLLLHTKEKSDGNQGLSRAGSHEDSAASKAANCVNSKLVSLTFQPKLSVLFCSNSYGVKIVLILFYLEIIMVFQQ